MIYLRYEIRLLRISSHRNGGNLKTIMTVDFRMKGDFLPHLVYALILPAFFLAGTLLYDPFGIKEYYTFNSLSYGFHIVMLSCIILVCALITRLILYVVMKESDFRWVHYGIWCIGEMTVMSAFAALYTVLFKRMDGGYFAVLPDCFKFIFLTLCYPYIFLVFIRIVRILDEDLQRKSTPEDNSLIRFVDEHKRLKLSIAPSSILFIKSEFNYVKIFYLDGGKVRDYMLRASMKSLEAIGSRALVRCQRSYFVNPEHVTVLRKDAEGFIFAELNIPDIPAVPVSKQYYDHLSSLL